MSTTDDPQYPTDNAPTATIQDLSTAVSNVHLNEPNDNSASAQPAQDAPLSRPLITYTRKQMLALSKSPLIKLPDGMPPFKAWYGELNEQALSSNRKDADPAPSNVAARNARYRRDGEDGEAPSRPSFRSTLSQPSQMGNFKHQPLRGADRDRDRDRETEVHLRTLSDKYDRERGRIGAPSHSALLRNRDRDSAPHLPSGRDGGKKRNGESNEDWRRGAEPPRNSRDEHHPRRDRDDRDRPRSRARDSSRPRESPHSSRREREGGERGDRRDRDRDDNRNHDFLRRDRDRDRFADEDDSRRWREDGKRDERMSQRREKDRGEHSRERVDDDQGRDHEAWRSPEESRGQKRGPRERRLGGGAADPRDRDDRREREKEKEPAWMETYVPPSSSGGILGGKGFGNEVDSIQAWKKDMKEREMKAKGLTVDSADTATQPTSNESQTKDASSSSAPLVAPEGQQLDEIQLFKLMMKQAKTDSSSDGRPSPAIVSPNGPENGISGLMRIRGARPATSTANPAEGASSTVPTEDSSTSVQSERTADVKVMLNPSQSDFSSSSPSSVSNKPPPTFESTDDAAARQAPFARTEDVSSRIAPSKATASADTKSAIASTTFTSPFEPPRQSRLLALGAQSSKSALHAQSLPPVVQVPRPTQQPMETLLWNGQLPAVTPAFPSQQGGLEKHDVAPTTLRQLDMANAMAHGFDGGSTSRGTSRESGPFLQFETTSRLSMQMESARDPSAFSGASTMDPSRASNMNHPSALDRNAAYAAGSDAFHQLPEARNGGPTPPLGGGYGGGGPLMPFDNQLGATAPSYAAGKGSRMAKHFERQRENQISNIVRAHAANANAAPLVGRQDSPGFNGPQAVEQRNITDLLAMLNSSAQAQQTQRGHQQQLLSNHNGLGQNSAAMSLQAQQQMHLHGIPLNSVRHDMVLDSDDRFVADGLVPGLRPVPTPRMRDNSNSGMFGGLGPDDLQFLQRLPPQQQRNLEQLYGGPISPQFAGQGPGAGRGIHGLQQPPLRGGPSPIGNFNPVQGPTQQRLPPGLANLGARPPPHEASQFMSGGGVSGGLGIPSQGLLGGLQQHANGPQALNQFHNAGLGVGANQPHLRGPPVGMGNVGGGGSLGTGMNGVGGLGSPAGMDFRGQFVPPQNQMVNIGAPGVGGGGMRGVPGFNPQNVHALGSNVASGPTLGLRQQPQQQGQLQGQPQGPQHHLQGPQMMQQMMPGQMQQPHGFPNGQHNQTDLMALLMGGGHRE